MAYDISSYWQKYFANREAQRVLARNGLGNFGTPPPTGGAVMGGAAPSAPSQALVPITKEGVRVGEGVVESAVRPAAASKALVPFNPASALPPPYTGPTIASNPLVTGTGVAGAEGGGLVNALRSGLGLSAAEGTGARAALAGVAGKVALPIGLATGGLQLGGMLDESNWLGGNESAANDYASKALKLGGLGAGIGTLVTPGVGTAVGGLIGAGLGLGWEGLERAGVLKAPTVQEQIDTTIHDADRTARRIGLPEEVVQTLKEKYRAEASFLERGDKPGRMNIADGYAAMLKDEAISYASDPEGYLQRNNIGSSGSDEVAAKRAMILQSVMVNTIKPYADQYQQQSEANAQMLEGMAGSAGALAPLYQQQAAQQRAMGTMYASNLVNAAQISPYQQALEKQASYLNSMSSNLVQQAMGQVQQNGQNVQAGSTDLTAIIDNAMNQSQPA